MWKFLFIKLTKSLCEIKLVYKDIKQPVKPAEPVPAIPTLPKPTSPKPVEAQTNPFDSEDERNVKKAKKEAKKGFTFARLRPNFFSLKFQKRSGKRRNKKQNGAPNAKRNANAKRSAKKARKRRRRKSRATAVPDRDRIRTRIPIRDSSNSKSTCKTWKSQTLGPMASQRGRAADRQNRNPKRKSNHVVDHLKVNHL